MINGQEHVLHMTTLNFRCHRDLHETYQRVSPEVMEQRGLALVSCFLRAAIQHLGDLKAGLPVEVFLCRNHQDMEGFLYDRAQGVTSTKDDLQKEHHHLSDVLRQNSYPVAFIRFQPATSPALGRLQGSSLNEGDRPPLVMLPYTAGVRHQASLQEVQLAGDLQLRMVTPLGAVQSEEPFAGRETVQGGVQDLLHLWLSLHYTVFTWTYVKWVQPGSSASVSHGSKSLRKSSKL